MEFIYQIYSAGDAEAGLFLRVLMAVHGDGARGDGNSGAVCVMFNVLCLNPSSGAVATGTQR
jgi:hypothetical protein